MPACCYAPPFLSIRFLSGGSSCPPKRPGAELPQLLLEWCKCQKWVWERQPFFCVQWTAGTFQITAEFQMSTKAASKGWLFVCPCPLISFSIRPNWFVSTTIHTGSEQHWQRIPDSCLDVFCLFKFCVLHLSIEYANWDDR